MVYTGYGLGRYLGDCRPALPEGWKYQMVKTQTRMKRLSVSEADLQMGWQGNNGLEK